jgi:hypothetical protein
VLASAATNENRNADGYHHRGHKNPERQNEIQDDPDRDKSDEPSQSVAPDDTAFHASAIDRSTDVS